MSMKNPEVFVSANGKKLVYPAVSDHDGSSYFAPDGVTFYELHQLGSGGRYCGDEIHENASFDAPQIGLKIDAERHNSVVTISGEEFVQTDECFDQNATTIVPLPNDRKIEYLCVDDDGTIVYVSVSKYQYSYESFRLFFVRNELVREVPVLRVSRYRDGGTTTVSTPEGAFHSPTPFKTDKNGDPLPPTWNGQTLARVPREAYSDYVIVEDVEGGVVSIAKK